MQLSRIKINNFRSLKNVEINELNKVNIFMGKNNSGKSSILQAIYFAKNGKDPLLFTFDECVFSQNGDNIQDIEILLETVQNDTKLVHETHWKRSGAVTTKQEFPVNDIYYLMADRGIFHRTSSISGGKMSDVGLHGEHTNRAMVYIKQNEENKFTKIRKFAEEMDIGTKNIDNFLINEANSQVTFVDSQNNLKFNILLGGFGQSQLLPLIVQAFDAPPGSVLLFEEPEVSLHPGAQRTLLEKFSKFVIDENKQMFLTSHSSYFLDTILRWNHDKNPLLKQIALFSVSRKDGTSSVTPITPENISDTEDFYQKIPKALKEFYQR